MSSIRSFSTLLAVAALASSLCAAPAGETLELDESAVFIEFNSTDGDFGIQFFWDGEPWKSMVVKGPNPPKSKTRTVLRVKATGNVKDQGLTEGFFESNEPDVEELTMEEFMARFPEGEYEFRGKGIEKGVKLEGDDEFTHVLPAPPANLFPMEGGFVDATLPLLASFDAVTTDLDGAPLEPELYEVVLETESDDLLRVFSITLPGDTADPSVSVPPEFLDADTEYKLEVIVQEESGNRTIAETTFMTLP